MHVSFAPMIGVMWDAQHCLCDVCPQIELGMILQAGCLYTGPGAVYGEIKAGTLRKGGSIRRVLGRWSSERSG